MKKYSFIKAGSDTISLCSISACFFYQVNTVTILCKDAKK